MRGALLVAGALALAGCRGCGGAAASAPAVDAAKSALCREVRADKGPDGRWSVQFDTGGAVLEAHGKRFSRRKLVPNGPAWVGVVEQCMTASTVTGVEMNEEAGAFFAWVDSDEAKDRLVGALCKALDDADWLERCIAGLDPARL